MRQGERKGREKQEVTREEGKRGKRKGRGGGRAEH